MSMNLGPDAVICASFKALEVVTPVYTRDVGDHPICIQVSRLHDYALQRHAMLIRNGPADIPHRTLGKACLRKNSNSECYRREKASHPLRLFSIGPHLTIFLAAVL
jgi:hypothetical protein